MRRLSTRLFSSRPAARKYLIGGNWKCNGTRQSVQELVQMLNDAGKLHPSTEVIRFCSPLVFACGSGSAFACVLD
jgi:triosephosphate isomerase